MKTLLLGLCAVLAAVGIYVYRDEVTTALVYARILPPPDEA